MKPPGRSSEQQCAPAFERVGHVMQHAAGVDHIEAAPDRAELEDVGLRVFDALGECRRRLALGVTKTAQAEIDRQHAGARIFLRGPGGVPAGAAAGDQNIEVGGLPSGVKAAVGNMPRRYRSSATGSTPPARSPSADRDFLRIAAERAARRRRRSAVSRGIEARSASSCKRFAQLLGHHLVERGRPSCARSALARPASACSG